MIHKFPGIFTTCTKVKQVDLACLLVVQEVAPVGVGLHEVELKHLPQTELKQLLTNLHRWRKDETVASQLVGVPCMGTER